MKPGSEHYTKNLSVFSHDLKFFRFHKNCGKWNREIVGISKNLNKEVTAQKNLRHTNPANLNKVF